MLSSISSKYNFNFKINLLETTIRKIYTLSDLKNKSLGSKMTHSLKNAKMDDVMGLPRNHFNSSYISNNYFISMNFENTIG